MAQIFWEQIKNELPSEGEFLTGSLSISGSFGTSGSIYYNGQLIEDLFDQQTINNLASSTDPDFGTIFIDNHIAIATGSFRFVDGVLKAGLFRQTGSYYSTTNNIKISGSLDIDFNSQNDHISITSQSIDVFKVTNQGVVQLKQHNTPPEPNSGSMYYGSDDQFYFGFKN